MGYFLSVCRSAAQLMGFMSALVGNERTQFHQNFI